MLKISFKYLAIAILNVVVLATMMALWTDKPELMLNSGVRQCECIIIGGK